MSSFSRADVQAQQGKVKTFDEPVPEWGDDKTLKLRPLGSGSRLQWVIARDRALMGESAPDPTALLVVLSAVDDNGQRLFTVQDVDWLASDEIDGGVIDRVSNKVMEISGMTGDPSADVEEAKNDSSESLSGSTPTDSLETSGAPSPS